MIAVELKTQRFFCCPKGCAYKFTVEHLFEMLDEPNWREHPVFKTSGWYCDVCDQGYAVNVYRDGRVEVEERERLYHHTTIIEIPPQTQPIRLKLKSSRTEPQIDHGYERFRCEENTSLVNLFRDVEEVTLGDDDHDLNIDPKFIAAYDVEVPDDAPAEQSPPGYRLVRRPVPVEGLGRTVNLTFEFTGGPVDSVSDLEGGKS